MSVQQITTPLEIYALLPKSNCGQCYLPSCLAFAAALLKDEKQPSDCPYLSPENAAQLSQRIQPRDTIDLTREDHLQGLQNRIKTIKFPDAVKRLGARLIGQKLAIQCLGKDFLVEQHGKVSSACHTHPGLTIPLLTYIVDAEDVPLTGEWVPFRELKDGAPMNGLFVQRCEKPLQQLVDNHTELFADLIDIFSGQRSSNYFASDISLLLYPLPKLPILICYCQPEEGMASQLSLFFDASAGKILPIDSIYSLTVGLIVMFEKISLQHRKHGH